MSASTRDLIHSYYHSWASQDRGRVRELLADSLDFRSAEDRFEGADAFLERCWEYAEGLAGVTFLREVYDGDQAFVVLEWRFAGGQSFVGAEYVRARSGRLHEILVVNSSPAFAELFDR